MHAEFTVLLKPHPKGVRASVAELEGVSAVGGTLEEVRAKLVERVRANLEAQRRKAIARAGPEVALESVRVELSNSPAPKREKARRHKARRKSREEPNLLQVLLQEGLIVEIPPMDSLDTDRLPFISVKGKPISEEIIEDRR
jgi:hypothetical protein